VQILVDLFTVRICTLWATQTYWSSMKPEVLLP